MKKKSSIRVNIRLHLIGLLLADSLLAVGLKRFGKGVPRVVHGVGQRQIVQLGTTAKVALRKDMSAHHQCFRLTSEL